MPTTPDEPLVLAVVRLDDEPAEPQGGDDAPAWVAVLELTDDAAALAACGPLTGPAEIEAAWHEVMGDAGCERSGRFRYWVPRAAWTPREDAHLTAVMRRLVRAVAGAGFAVTPWRPDVGRIAIRIATDD